MAGFTRRERRRKAARPRVAAPVRKAKVAGSGTAEIADTSSMRQFDAVLLPPLPYMRNTNGVSAAADNAKLVKDTRAQLLLFVTERVEIAVVRLELKYRLKLRGPDVVDLEPNEIDETVTEDPDVGVSVNSK